MGGEWKWPGLAENKPGATRAQHADSPRHQQRDQKGTGTQGQHQAGKGSCDNACEIAGKILDAAQCRYVVTGRSHIRRQCPDVGGSESEARIGNGEQRQDHRIAARKRRDRNHR